ncbi:acyltransferase family protein [Glutamicibacter sp.]|uniref:acyltransferase family protein n=1 Tax=Glutamicibacter sp. TaxID=1931995 RepID=UPI0028BD2B30|nr:acyltransferase family protein [Glutamicibacter sp.]
MTTTIAPPQQTEKKSGFRSDLQGLRALAVLLVMIYHIWFSRVSGGVDIFLMLSAFFLTASTAKRISRGQRPKVLSAWAHRFSRLVPQAAVVIMTIIAASWIFLPSNRWPALIDQSFASLLYRQNWYLAANQVNYYNFDHSSASPLQHFWSLSVQGQIFIIWPLILAFCALVWKLFLSRINFAWVAGAAFTLIFASSLSYSISITASNQQVAYFHTGARLWEFALGSLVALAMPWFATLPERLRRIGGWAGLVTIVTCGALLDVQGQFPGYMALVPTLGAALIIAAPAPRSWSNPSGVLSLPVLTKLGDLSYGMYLWHWPLLVFFLALSGTEQAGFFAGTVLIIVSIALAWCTTHGVEKPLSKWQSTLDFGGMAVGRQAQFVAGTLVLVIGIGAASVPALAWEGKVEQRRTVAATQSADENPGAMAPKDWDPSPAALTLPLATDLDSEWQTPGESCAGDNEPNDERIIFCAQGGDFTPGKPVLVMLGDSHVQHWSDAASKMMEEARGSWILVHHPGCRYGSTEAREVQECADFQDAAREYVKSLAPTWVMATGSMTTASYDEDLRSPGEQEHLVDNFDAAIQPFLDAGSKIIAVRDTPRYEYSIPECADSKKLAAGQCDREASERLNAVNPVDTWLQSKHYGDKVVSLDLTELLCPDGTCKAVIGNVLTYLDDSHLSKTFVDSAAGEFETAFRRATGFKDHGSQG